MLDATVFSRTDVAPFLAHECPCKSMVKDGSCKLEAFSLAKTENLFELVFCVTCNFFLQNFFRKYEFLFFRLF